MPYPTFDPRPLRTKALNPIDTEPEKDGELAQDVQPRILLTPADFVKIRERLLAIFTNENKQGLTDLLLEGNPGNLIRIDWDNAIASLSTPMCNF